MVLSGLTTHTAHRTPCGERPLDVFALRLLLPSSGFTVRLGQILSAVYSATAAKIVYFVEKCVRRPSGQCASVQFVCHSARVYSFPSLFLGHPFHSCSGLSFSFAVLSPAVPLLFSDQLRFSIPFRCGVLRCSSYPCHYRAILHFSIPCCRESDQFVSQLFHHGMLQVISRLFLSITVPCSDVLFRHPALVCGALLAYSIAVYSIRSALGFIEIVVSLQVCPVHSALAAVLTAAVFAFLSHLMFRMELFAHGSKTAWLFGRHNNRSPFYFQGHVSPGRRSTSGFGSRFLSP